MYTYQLKELTGEHIDKHLRDERIKAIASLDIDVFDDSKDASGTLSLQVEQFRQKYVGGHGSNIGQFVKDISKGCKNDDGSIDLHMLESRLASIEPMLNAFGTEYDMHLLVKDFAIAHGMLSYSGKKGKEIAVYAARQIKKSASLEQEERLRALQIMHAIQRSEGHYIYSGISRLERFANDHNRKLILAS
jgi:hypothetical protein